MEHTERDTITAGPYSYLGYRDFESLDEPRFISIADPVSREEVARVTRAADGATTLQTFGPPLPRITAEHLFTLADDWLS